MVEKAQQLFAYLVGDETVPNKTEVCNFCFKTDANKTAIVGNLCGKFGTFLFSSCMRAMQSIWCDREFRTLKFERRSRAANEDDYERKALWSREGVSRTLVFNPVLSLCRRVHNHAQCTLLVDSRSSS